MMRKEFESLPSPSEYEDWKSWAAILISSLSERGNQSALNIPVFVKDETKKEKGSASCRKGRPYLAFRWRGEETRCLGWKRMDYIRTGNSGQSFHLIWRIG